MLNCSFKKGGGHSYPFLWKQPFFVRLVKQDRATFDLLNIAEYCPSCFGLEEDAVKQYFGSYKLFDLTSKVPWDNRKYFLQDKTLMRHNPSVEMSQVSISGKLLKTCIFSRVGTSLFFVDVRLVNASLCKVDPTKWMPEDCNPLNQGQEALLASLALAHKQS